MMDQSRFQNFFVHNGQKHYTGTIFIVDNYGKHSEACFICYDTQYSKYIYKINGCTWRAHEDYFRRMFIELTGRIDPTAQLPQVKKRNDLDIGGMFEGWLIYIFLSIICFIAKGGFLYFIFVSIVFFVWRANKIKKEGTYIVW